VSADTAAARHACCCSGSRSSRSRRAAWARHLAQHPAAWRACVSTCTAACPCWRPASSSLLLTSRSSRCCRRCCSSCQLLRRRCHKRLRQLLLLQCRRHCSQRTGQQLQCWCHALLLRVCSCTCCSCRSEGVQVCATAAAVAAGSSSVCCAMQAPQPLQGTCQGCKVSSHACGARLRLVQLLPAAAAIV
jgi:hypothetical protein